MKGLDPGLGLSGRIAAFFQGAQITPLLALVGLLLGLFAVAVTPREEEPQINVTMANVLVALPGASVADVEALITIPGEQVLSRIAGVEHVMAVARPGQAVLTVQFKVGVPRTEALVRLQDTVQSHADWLPPGLGASPPLIKPLGIDDVPMLSLTLHSADPDIGPMDLERVARGLESELKRVPGTRDIQLIGGPGRRLLVALDPERMNRAGLSVAELRQALQGAHQGAQIGERVQGDHSVMLEAGPYLRDARELEDLIVGVQAGRPVALRDVAEVREGSLPGSARVWHRVKDQDRPALTLAITKKAGENAIDVARALQARVAELRGTLLPSQIEVEETRNYGQTADEKARQLIQKLLFATASVVALVFLALGRREAAIVGAAVILTLAATLFASWAWGFTLNRVSLFALIFSIGILVDDAIVVVENIHRHQQLHPQRSLRELIPGAVDEVGGPTILATFTVIAALLPMAFVSGLMGPYMAPIPINASMGMLISLAIAFVVTPWLARLLMKALPAGQSADPEALHGLSKWLAPRFERLFGPLLDAQHGARNRRRLGLGVAGLIVVSLALPGVGAVPLEDAALRQQERAAGHGGHAGGHAGGAHGGGAAGAGRLGGSATRGAPLAGLRRHLRADQFQRPGAAVLPAYRSAPGRPGGEPGPKERTQGTEPCHRHPLAPGAAAHRAPPWCQSEGRRGAPGAAGAGTPGGRDLWPRGQWPRASGGGGAQDPGGRRGRGRCGRLRHRGGAARTPGSGPTQGRAAGRVGRRRGGHPARRPAGRGGHLAARWQPPRHVGHPDPGTRATGRARGLVVLGREDGAGQAGAAARTGDAAAGPSRGPGLPQGWASRALRGGRYSRPHRQPALWPVQPARPTD